MSPSQQQVRPVSPKKPFAIALGRRIDEAWDRAGFRTRMDMFRATSGGLPDYNQLSRWCRGAAVPGVEYLAVIAQTCEVSLDWLVFGTETTPQAFVDWLSTPTGREADEGARSFLRSLPLHGYQATATFYDLAYQAWKLGVTRDMSATDAARMARDTELEDRGGPKP